MPLNFKRLLFFSHPQEAYDSCNADLGVVRTWQTISSTGDVNVTGLDIGTAYFLCYLVSHCSAGGMRLQVEVLPPMTRYFVTVWTLSGGAATPVNITFTGVDDRSRVWTAPPMQLNQHATDGLWGGLNVKRFFHFFFCFIHSVILSRPITLS